MPRKAWLVRRAHNPCPARRPNERVANPSIERTTQRPQRHRPRIGRSGGGLGQATRVHLPAGFACLRPPLMSNG